MARQRRIEYKGAIYHILSRGNQRQEIFKTDKDREQFLELLGIASIRFKLEIYAYVLMGNHYHILLKTKNANLSKAMQWIGSTYTRRYNIKYKQSGHLFQSRFKSILVENETYLLRLSYYIHRNPLRARLIRRLADYRWSSYQAYAYKKTKTPFWLNTDFVLSKLEVQDKHRYYRTKSQNYADETRKIREEVKFGLLYGSEQFANKLKAKYKKSITDVELTQYNRLQRDIDIDELIKQSFNILDCNLEQIKITCHSSSEIKQNRDLIVYCLKSQHELSNRKIGDRFNLSYSAVSKIVTHFQNQLNNNVKLQRKLKYFNSQFKV